MVEKDKVAVNQIRSGNLCGKQKKKHKKTEAPNGRGDFYLVCFPPTAPGFCCFVRKIGLK
jgi:hypothetical protein